MTVWALETVNLSLGEKIAAPKNDGFCIRNGSFCARENIRDSKNEGPSMVQAFGMSQGGQLRYWPGDDGSMEIKQVMRQLPVEFGVKKYSLIIIGSRCHEVQTID